MESIINNQSLPVYQQWSRNLLFSLLGRLKNAQLTVRDELGVSRFGDPESDLHAHLLVHDTTLYTRILTGGSIGAAESYVDGDWESEELVNVMRIFARNIDTLDRMENRLGWARWIFSRLIQFKNRNTRKGSKDNIAAHYDLGNDLYELLLDKQMQYSSAVFQHPGQTLDLAQENKLELICQKLELSEQDHLLEIGTGWGGLACHAARNYGCKVTTTTLSKEQFRYAQDMVARQGLGDKVTLLLKDYRDLDGHYSKLVSVEMIEAVGHEFLQAYFAQLQNLLQPRGKMLIQAITIDDRQYDQYRKSVDFIQKFIFPGGCLPSIHEISRHLKQSTSLQIRELIDYGLDYAKTIEHWTQSLTKHGDALQLLGYDERFQRLWHYYFAYCRGGFMENHIGLVHLLAHKPR